jgi:hypothetical protein
MGLKWQRYGRHKHFMPMFSDKFINFKPAKEFHMFKIVTDFFDNMNEKLHTHHTSIYIPN